MCVYVGGTGRVGSAVRVCEDILAGARTVDATVEPSVQEGRLLVHWGGVGVVLQAYCGVRVHEFRTWQMRNAVLGARDVG